MATNNYCPHCKQLIELVPDINGRTIVVDAEEVDFVVGYPSGFVKLKKGRKVHSCEKTGENGHVVR